MININNDFCSALSNVFSISFLSGPNNPVSNGDVSICSNSAIPPLSVSSVSGTIVNWYDAITGGALLQSSSNSFIPTAAGTYYAEAFDPVSNCRSSGRTAVILSIETIPVASVSSSSPICSGDSATINFVGTPNAVISYTVNGGANQTQTLDALGQANFVIPNVSTNQQINLISVATGTATNCSQSLSQSININVTSALTASISAASTICSGGSAVVSFAGTPNATVNYSIDGGVAQPQILDSAGQATLTIPNVVGTRQIDLISVF